MTSPRRGNLRIGTSGYQYDHWRDNFYPPDLPKTQWFEHYASVFDTVEINGTFYSLPDPEVFDSWREEAPEGFLHTLKFSRYGSHIKRLKDGSQVIDNFVERAERLADHLGPVLVQLPPNWKPNLERLEEFLGAARQRDIRWAVEFRDPRWLCPGVFDLLRQNGAALVVHDLIEDHPREITADWVYVRCHGWDYAGCYSDKQLDELADWIARRLGDGLDAYVYFNNDAEGFAPQNALDLRGKVHERL